MAFLAVHNPDWSFNCESKVFFAVYSLIRKLPASHHSPVPSRDASVLQSNLPLNCEKKNLLKCFSVVIIKNTIKVWPWYPEETFVSPTKDNNRLLGYLRGSWVDLWGFSLFFWLLYFSASTFLWYFGFCLYKLSSSKQMLRVTFLKVNLSEHGLYVSVYQVFLPSNKIFICVVCFRNWTEKVFLKSNDLKN